MVRRKVKILTKVFLNLELVGEGNESSHGTCDNGSESEDCFNPKLLNLIQPSKKLSNTYSKP